MQTPFVHSPATPAPSTPPFSSIPNAVPPPNKSSSLSLHMPPDVAANANLATQDVPTDAPSWAIAHNAAHPQSNGNFEVMGSRTYHDIFHLPNLGGVVRKWLFTRPTMEAISEDSFSNSAVESMTLFRIEQIDNVLRSLMITPTVSSHYMFIPCQTINGYTVGLAYLDTTYERDSTSIKDNRVPPLRLGRFVIEDATGEIFCSAWMDNMMVVAWTQSIIKCERVREFLLFEAPPDGTPPKNLLIRNSFFERRSCYLCGKGPSIINLPPPCSGVDNRKLSQDPTIPVKKNVLTNIASIYRRFRGSYFGVVLKIRYGSDREPISQQLVPIFAELKHGLHTVKCGFKNNLRKNIDIVLGAASNDGYFGVNPRSAARSSLLLLRASNPVVADNLEPTNNDDAYYKHHSHSATPENCSEVSGLSNGSNSKLQKRKRSYSPSSSKSGFREGSVISTEGDECDNNQQAKGENSHHHDGTLNVARRRRSEDPLERDSIMHKRKVRNRISAQKSNKLRKMMLEQKKADLRDLKVRLPKLQQRLEELKRENLELKIRAFGENSAGLKENIKQEQQSENNTLKLNEQQNEQQQQHQQQQQQLQPQSQLQLHQLQLQQQQQQQYVNNKLQQNNTSSFDELNKVFNGRMDFDIEAPNLSNGSQMQMGWSFDDLKADNAIPVCNINNQHFE